MILTRKVSCQMFTIWQPRWHDKVVLLAAHKVGTHNKIVFTKAPTYPGEYYISGKDVHMCPQETNGTIMCYAVPLNQIEPIEYKDDITEAQEILNTIKEIGW